MKVINRLTRDLNKFKKHINLLIFYPKRKEYCESNIESILNELFSSAMKHVFCTYTWFAPSLFQIRVSLLSILLL